MSPVSDTKQIKSIQNEKKFGDENFRHNKDTKKHERSHKKQSHEECFISFLQHAQL